MASRHLICVLIGFSASLPLLVPRWRKRGITMEKLRLINEALNEAEERVVRYQERHDRILGLITSSYLVHKDLEEALAGAQTTMKEALEFAVGLRQMQMKILSSYPHETKEFSLQDRSNRSRKR
ncbi:hypothetical protein H6P81_015088 [Aristolochia fimbriata]|uniref:Uncharacterized protein n=1 Tax=Aristolochia fimbriata TaxID=158543 RepID=A0AAV7E914_ARIFI|nr:hypothetical protein H6P81_015088 [Aristolochia fimbriata]